MENHIQNELTYLGLLACSCESVYFILNVTQVSFAKIVNIIEIPWYELWKVMDFYIRFDSSMPNNLKIHLLDLEVKIISSLAW